DLGRAVARDEGDFADLAGGVEGAQQGHQVRDRGGRADLDADRVGDAAEVLDVCAVDLAGAVADPEEVRRGVVVGFLACAGGCVGLGRGDGGGRFAWDGELPG